MSGVSCRQQQRYCTAFGPAATSCSRASCSNFDPGRRFSIMWCCRNLMTIGPGVEPERIMRESFVSPVPKNAHAETLALEEGVAVEFGRSGNGHRSGT